MSWLSQLTGVDVNLSGSHSNSHPAVPAPPTLQIPNNSGVFPVANLQPSTPIDFAPKFAADTYYALGDSPGARLSILQQLPTWFGYTNSSYNANTNLINNLSLASLAQNNALMQEQYALARQQYNAQLYQFSQLPQTNNSTGLGGVLTGAINNGIGSIFGGGGNPFTSVVNFFKGLFGGNSGVVPSYNQAPYTTTASNGVVVGNSAGVPADTSPFPSIPIGMGIGFV